MPSDPKPMTTPKTGRTHRSRRVVIKDVVRYKTVLCDKFSRFGECPYGAKCQFAHGDAELRPRAAPCQPCNTPVVPAPTVPAAGHAVQSVPYMQGLLLQRPGAVPAGPVYLPSGHAVPVAPRPPLTPPPPPSSPAAGALTAPIAHGTVGVVASVLAKNAARGARNSSPLARRGAPTAVEVAEEEEAPEWADWQPEQEGAAADAWQPAVELPTWGAELAPLPAAAASAAAAEDVALRRTKSGCQRAGLLHCDAATGKVEPLWLGRSKSGNLSFNTRAVCMQIADVLGADDADECPRTPNPKTPIRKSLRTRTRSAASRLSAGFLATEELAPAAPAA